MNNPYLEGLNTIRFFLVLLVVLFHSNQNLTSLNINWFSDAQVFLNGGLAVNFFFILSGFLLTHLALSEFKHTGSIHIKHFFARRILRIFPLYYLSVFLGYFILGFLYPKLQVGNYLAFTVSEGLPYHLLFLPNFMISKYHDGIGALYSLWSIGVEEQFYLFFPFLMIFVFKKKYPIAILLTITIFYYLFYHYIERFGTGILSDLAVRFIFTLKFHFMFMGTVTAVALSKYKYLITTFLKSKISQILLWLSIIFVVFFNNLGSNYIIAGILFCLLIISVSDKNIRLFNIEQKTFNYLGSISYGIYIFHPFVSYPIRFILTKFGFILHFITTFPIFYYFAETIMSILFAHLSYQYYEKRFLKMKLIFLSGAKAS